MDKSVLKRFNDLRILFVEDDDLLRGIIRDALSLYCQDVQCANDGEEGLACFHNGNFNVIITDINLPKMNGLVMAKEIRKVNSEISIIVLTAYDTSDNIYASIDICACAFLHKPFELEQLYNTLLMCLSKIVSKHQWLDLSRGFSYNLQTKELFCDEKEIHLTKNESRLLAILIDHLGKTVSFENIEGNVWYDKSATPETIRMLINKLRAKTYYELIENIQGYGYKLSPKANILLEK